MRNIFIIKTFSLFFLLVTFSACSTTPKAPRIEKNHTEFESGRYQTSNDSPNAYNKEPEQIDSSPWAKPQGTTGNNQTSNRRGEDWYAYWSVGISDNTYPADLQNEFDNAQALGFSRTEVAIDALGFYWPIGQKTINGFVVSGTNDTLSLNGSTLSLKTYLYSYSVMHYFGQEPGDGFYLRGD